MDEQTTERKPKVSEWVERLRVSLQRADGIQVEIAERLSPILRTDDSIESEAAPEEPIETLALLATEIRDYVFHLDILSDQYQEMLHRLEI